jgi:hypothetical protein
MAIPDITAHVSIADAMRSLRTQILAAADQTEDTDLTFTVREIEVEFQVALTTKVQGSAKVSLWSVLTFGAGGEHASDSTHRVRLLLEPHRIENGTPHQLRLHDDE